MEDVLHPGRRFSLLEMMSRDAAEKKRGQPIVAAMEHTDREEELAAGD
jgi:hypothetical protein